MRRVLLALFVLSLLPITWSSTVSAQDIQYVVLDLIQAHKDPAFNIQGTGATAINDSGYIVGFTGESEIKSSPFYSLDGEPVRVKTGEYGATFNDINADMIIVGRDVTGRTETGAPIGAPAYWVRDEMTHLEIPPDPNGGAFVSGRAVGINLMGDIVGEVQFEGDDNRHVVVWTPRSTTILPPAFGYSYCEGAGINDDSQVGGSCWNPDAQIYQPVVWVNQVPEPIAAPEGYGTVVTAITTAENLPVLVGGNYNTGDVVTEINAVVFSNGESTWLPAPEGLPACMAISVADTDSGLMVAGVCGPSAEELNVNVETGRATAWLDGELVDLDEATGNDGDWTFLYLADVNEDGAMVGYGERNGERRSFVLNPIG